MKLMYFCQIMLWVFMKQVIIMICIFVKCGKFSGEFTKCVCLGWGHSVEGNNEDYFSPIRRGH